METSRTLSSESRLFPRLTFRILQLGCMLATVTALSGCGPSPGSPYKLNRELALDSLKLFMETWRDQGSLAALKDRQPSIVGKDADWNKGAKLLAFTISPDGRDDGTNLYVDVQLDLQTSSGEKRQKTIRYVVGTEPVVSIFRED